MNTPIPIFPSCVGLCCDIHARCARYWAVEGSSPDDERMGTCLTDDGYPLFVEVAPAPADQVS